MATEAIRLQALSDRIARERVGERIFRSSTFVAALLVLLLLGGVIVALLHGSWPALSTFKLKFITTEIWNPVTEKFGALAPIYGTLMTSLIAMLVAVPLSFGISIFLTELAPAWLKRPVGTAIELLAAVPSIIYGLWGALFLVPHLTGLNMWLDEYLGWTVVFEKEDPQGAARSIFTVGVLLAIMILPIITNVSREVFRQVPSMHEEAALALGATRWETIRMSVLPFARSGIISASMLGLGRALGETMAVATVLSAAPILSVHVLDPVGGTFSQNIVAKFGEANEFGRDALIASGLVLFVITLLVNGAARMIIARRKEYSGANA